MGHRLWMRLAASLTGLCLIALLAACRPGPSPSSLSPAEPSVPPTTAATAADSTPEATLRVLLDCLRSGDAATYWTLFSPGYRFTPEERQGSAFAPQAVSDAAIDRLDDSPDGPDRAVRSLAFTLTGGNFPPPPNAPDSDGRVTYFYYVELTRTADGWRIASLATTP